MKFNARAAALCAFAVLLVADSKEAAAQILWQNTSVGMTADEIRRAQPLAQNPSQRQTLHSGAVCELELPNYDVGSEQFRVCFFLRDGRLSQVTMSAIDPSVPGYETLTSLLRSRYGRELSSTPSSCVSGGVLVTCRTEWLLESGVNVTLFYSDMEGRLKLLSIVYQTRLRDVGERL